MTRIVVDAELLSKLSYLSGPLEFCSESGQVFGKFMPDPDREAALKAMPELSEAELKRRSQEPGYSTEQVIAYLESL
ncbi:MAG: hypothetical protein B7Z73_09675 [Planctomycetia bacterium 21-64-5]|nr:MAG: hypothetical protein B7Z73_09675 [Planctomycetia bacterium 21-64-5]HQU41277.1 hypothetical protein [Pirellulales bacterium]